MNKYVKYWIDSADHDLDVAESLFVNDKYDWCLFIAHLVLEKTMQEVEQDPPKFFLKIKQDGMRIQF